MGSATGRRAGGGDAKRQGTDSRTAPDTGAGSPLQKAGTGERHTKKGYRSLDVGRDESYALIDQLSEQKPVEMVCKAFDISRSSYYEYRQRCNIIDAERLALRAKVKALFINSRRSAGSRTLTSMLKEKGVTIGRFKVRRLMGESGLVCKQPGPHAYKNATVERPDIPNHLARQFTVERPNQVWCGDITYIWSGQRWSYLAVVLDLFARRVVGWAMSSSPDADLTVKALDHACGNCQAICRLCSIPKLRPPWQPAPLFAPGLR